ncbi:MAG: hypothetical protein PHQ65_11885 [Bacteroidales bacterium]|nr:hypothetical protein [Bacteroidales bacterium]
MLYSNGDKDYFCSFAELFSFGRSIMDDIPDFKEMELSVNEFKQEHFDWLIEKSKWQSKSFKIVNRFKKQEKMNERKKHFKIGTFHGTLNPVDGSKEAKLRNVIYLIGNLLLPLTNTKKIKIRVIGYEIPIENKGKRIDILGYDSELNPWIIELKADSSNEKIADIVNQINDYANILPLLLPGITNEFKNKFFLDLKLTNNIKKIILAPREYYLKQDKTSYPLVSDIYLCSLARLQKVFDSENNLILDSKLNQFDELTLKIENR